MTRAEIKSKFDEIVAFAETENFLDTPVKRYSSGMYVRLAFAVAAHHLFQGDYKLELHLAEHFGGHHFEKIKGIC